MRPRAHPHRSQPLPTWPNKPLLRVAIGCVCLAQLACDPRAGSTARAAKEETKEKTGADTAPEQAADAATPQAEGKSELDAELAAEDAQNDRTETNQAAKDGDGDASGLGRLESIYDDADDTRPDAVKQSERDLLSRLRQRSDALGKDRQALALRDAQLQKVQRELQARLAEITQLEERLQIVLGIGRAAKNRRSERVTALSELILKMAPQSGAEIMAQMSDADAQAILLALARNEPRKAAKILSQMPSSRAAELSQKYLNTELTIPGSEDLIPKEGAPTAEDVAKAAK